MSVVHFVVPEGVDDPERPSGGNFYDRRLSRALGAIGWAVREHAVAGSWPVPTSTDRATLGAVVAGIPDGAVVLLDGLVASAAPEVLGPEADRLRLVVLVHMPLGEGPVADEVAVVRAREDAVLSAAVAVVTTSEWTRGRLLDRHSVAADRVHVAEPGVDPADLAPGTASGGELLCVAAVSPHKGHDVLFDALARIRHLPWRCTCVGSLDRDPEFVARMRRAVQEHRIDDRVRFTGPLTGERLYAAYGDADVFVLASRGETYGMVVTEALAHGLPVIATAVGGVPLALGHGSDGSPPGLLVPPDEPAALAEALCAWLGDAELRRRLRDAAEQRRASLTGWSATAEQVSRVLTEAV